MKIEQPFTLIPYDGDLQNIDKFYSMLGLNISNGRLLIEKVEIIFGNHEDGIEDLQIWINVESDFKELEQILNYSGGKILQRGIGGSGPYFIVEDPAGLKLHIGMTPDQIAEFAKGLS